jgi:TRAP-type C4-dicarboxylate transport system substrate-binding protein
VKFVPHFAGALVPLNETMKAVRDGSVPAGVISAAAITGQIPAFAYLEAIGGMPAETGPFVEAVNALRPVLETEFRKQGVEYLWSQGSGGLIVVCRDRHLKTPADWKNRKVRTAGRWQAEQLRAMGVSPVATDPSEQYIALQNRTIDCALSVNVLASALKLHEVAPRITQLRMPVNLTTYVINKSMHDKISAADRAAMKKLSAEADKRSAEHLAKVEADAIAQMKSQKADIYSLSDQELKALRTGIAPSFAKMDAEGGDTGKQIGSILKKYW